MAKKSCWTKLYYRVSDYSNYYFWLQLIVNASMIGVSIVTFLLMGKFKVTDENLKEFELGAETQMVSKGSRFTLIFIAMMAISQFYVGVHAVVAADQILLQNAFDLFGYCTITTFTNFLMAALYYVAINPFSTGMRYSSHSPLRFVFEVSRSDAVQPVHGLVHVRGVPRRRGSDHRHDVADL